MLFMVVETIPEIETVRERLAREGRLLPHGVKIVSSHGVQDGRLWFLLLEAENVAMIEAWAQRWTDLAAFDIYPVEASRDFWARQAAAGVPDPFEEVSGG